MVQTKLKPKCALAWLLTLCLVFGMLPMAEVDSSVITTFADTTEVTAYDLNSLQAAIGNYASAVNDMVITVDSHVSIDELLSIPANSNGKTLKIKGDLDSGAITLTRGITGDLITVNNGASLTLEDIVIDGGNTGTYSTGSGGVLVKVGTSDTPGGTFTMINGATLQNNTNNISSGGGVYIYGGDFMMSGNASVTSNSNTTNDYGGGGVCVRNGGTFIMNGNASITGNTATKNGGGVLIINSTFTMSGNALISSNSAKNGGGVYVDYIEEYSAFTMSGGIISGNIVTGGGGGVYVSGGEFTMTGGTITGCTAQTGGGVSNGEGTFNMSGGTITGNTATGSSTLGGLGGGGVYSSGTFNISSAPSITGNKISNGGADTGGVFLVIGNITVTSALGSDASIGIEGFYPTPAAGTTVALGATNPSYTLTTSDVGKFYISDSAGTIGGCSGFDLDSTNNKIGLGSGGGSTDTIINIAAISGVTAPIAGATPVTTITATDQYTGTVTWSPADSTFANGTAYTATITLTPKPNYTLTGVTQNLFTVAGATTVSNSANSGVVTAVFPDTAAAAIPRTTFLDLTVENVTYAGGVGSGNPTQNNIIDSTEGWKWYHNATSAITAGYTGAMGPVLVLEGLTLSTIAATALKVPTNTTIVLANSSTNMITSTSSINNTYGILNNGALTIQGSGTLNVTGGTAANFNYSYGIKANGLTISSGTVNATGGTVDTTNGFAVSYGIDVASGGLSISGGIVNATGGTGSKSYGIFCSNALNITVGTLTAIGNTCALSSDYTVPSGYTYWTNTSAVDPAGNGTVSTGDTTTDKIGSDTRFAKITTTGGSGGNGSGGNGSGGNSSGGNSSDYTPTPTPTNVIKVETNGTASYTATVKDNTLTAEVPVASINDSVEKLLKDLETDPDKAQVIEIKVSGASDEINTAEFSLPNAAIANVVEKTDAALFIDAGKLGTLVFDTNALTAILETGKGDLRIITTDITKETDNKLTDEQKATIGNNPVYDFSVFVGSERVSEFGLGTVTIRLPYTPKTGEDTDSIVVYYVDDKGNVQKVENSRYDVETGTVIFTTNHFSLYMIGNQFTVTYRGNRGGTVSGMPSDETMYDSGSKVTVIGKPVSTSKFFAGWNTKADGTGKLYTAGKTFEITEDITLYAQWRDTITSSAKITYKVTGKNEVACIGTTAKKATTITIADTFLYKGITYKVTSIAKNAFRANEKVTTVIIGNNVKTINNTAFYKCPNLKKVTIGTGLVTLGNDVFCHAKVDCVITINSTKLKTVKTAMNHGTKNMVIKVPKSKLSAYKKLFSETSKKITIEAK